MNCKSRAATGNFPSLPFVYHRKEETTRYLLHPTFVPIDVRSASSSLDFHSAAVHPLHVRGGHSNSNNRDLDDGSDDDDQYDEYDNEDQYDPEEMNDVYDEVEVVPSTQRRHIGPPSDTGPNNKYDHRMARPPPSSSAFTSRQGPPYNPKKKRTKHWTTRVATQSVKLTSQAAWKTVSGSGKLAYNLMRPKYVEPSEIGGLWRLDQEITLPSSRGRQDDEGRTLASVATIEFDPRKRVVKIKSIDGETLIQPYRFYVTRLGLRKMQFVARAFLIGESKARMYGYKGTWERKMADRTVLKLVGKIYEIKPPSRFSRRSKDQPPEFGKPIGTFVARRRVKLDDADFDEPSDYTDFEDEDEWDAGGDQGDDVSGGEDDEDFY